MASALVPVEQFLNRLPRKPRCALAGLAVTTMLVGLCFLALLGLRSQGGVLGFYLLFPGIFLAAIVFGRDVGIYGAALSTVLLYFLLTPGGRLLLPSEFILPLVIFVLIALGLVLVSAGLRTAWERAAAAERAKDVLLWELGHRTKNNLAMVISLLSLQARLKTDPETRASLEKAVLRIRAIADAHDHFRPSDRNGLIEMRAYLEKLCGHLGDTLRDIRPIAVRVDADEIHLPTEQAVPIGLIVNEIVTNALKHAFPDNRAGSVKVALRQHPSLTLTVADDGIGCSAGKREGIGSRLMQLFAKQLGATITWEDAAPGCRVRVVLAPD
jgi:two-component system, sensor histidine kinase PdtaS